MKKLILIFAVIGLACIMMVQTAGAFYVRIENIGPAPLAALGLRFDVETSPGVVETFQVFSHRMSVNPTNDYFPFYFDEYLMIPPGVAFDTYLIPELTDKQVSLVGHGMSTYNAFSGGDGPFVDIIPDSTTVDLISSSPAIPLAVRVSFHSGGLSVPIPTPFSYCVSTAAELQHALNFATTNEADDVIKIQEGTYNGNFAFAATEPYGLTIEGYSSSRKMERAKALFERIREWYWEQLKSPEGRLMVEVFDELIDQHVQITDIKKIDFVLWQIRN